MPKRRAASPDAGQRGSPPSAGGGPASAARASAPSAGGGPASAARASAPIFAVAYGGGPLIVEECQAFSRYLTKEDLGAVLCEAGLKWVKGHPNSRSDIIVLGDLERCHSGTKADTHTGSGMDQATRKQVDAAAAGTRAKFLGVLSLPELMARFPSVAAAEQRWTRFCDWASVQGGRKFRAPGKARNFSLLAECVPPTWRLRELRAHCPLMPTSLLPSPPTPPPPKGTPLSSRVRKGAP